MIEMLVVIYGIWTISLVIRAIVSMAGKPVVMLNEVLSNTRLVPTRALPPNQNHPEQLDQTVRMPTPNQRTQHIQRNIWR